MKLIVVKTHVAELVEIDDVIRNGFPDYFKAPYFIVLQGGLNIITKFEFLTRKDILNDNGKRKYFDMDIIKAEKFEEFNRAIGVASRFKLNDITGNEKFYVVGYQEALIVEMEIEANVKKFNQFIK